MNRAKISIIVPIYKVEPYLRRCLDSIVGQTYRDLEIILVDDGSPDNCGTICDEYAARDRRIKVIHKENGGVSSARNAGLEIAAGEWIGWVDPDDWIEPDMYEYLLTNAIAHNADVSVCEIRYFLNGVRMEPFFEHYDEVKVLDREQAIEMYLERNMHDGCVNKLYRRELWEGLRFPDYRVAEDMLALWEIFQRANITVRLPDDKYFYYRNSSSATVDKDPQKVLDDLRAVKKRYDEVMDRWPQLEKPAARCCWMSAEEAWEWYYTSATEEERRTTGPEIRKMVRLCIPYWKKYEDAGVGMYGRFRFRLVSHFPSRWAWTLSRLLDRLYARLRGPWQMADVYASPALRGGPKGSDVDNLHCISLENLIAISQNLAYTQNLRGYKRFLIGRRFKEQVLHGNWTETKDFFRWVLSKITRRNNGAKWLCTFDPLDAVQFQLRRAISLDNMLSQAAERALIKEDRNVILKTGRQIFIFAGVHYCDIGGGQRSAQLARAFNEMGYRVYYIHYLVHHIYGEGKIDPFREKTMFNPTLLHCQVDGFSVRDLDRLVCRDAPVPLFIFEVPVDKYEPYLDYAKAHHIPTMYEHIDNWDSQLGDGFYREHIFRRFLKECTLVTVTARTLGEKVKEVSPQTGYFYLPNAVNTTLFEPMKSYERPSDLVQGEKTLLYFGSLWGEWFDWEKIVYVAEHCACAINLIGGYTLLGDRRNHLPKNIHFLGEKPQAELPAYLAHSDIALLPFKNGKIGRYVSPLKIFEYIAMNKPVLATPLDDIAGYPNVFASDDKREWARAVAEEWPAIADTGVFTSQNSWYARCAAMMEYAGMLSADPPEVSVIISGHHCGDSIFRCVDSLLAFHSRYGREIIVVDSDGTCAALEERYRGEITLLRTGAGPGCARNLGSRASHGEFLFFMDGTQRAANGSYLDSALDILRREKLVGAVGWRGYRVPAETDTARISDVHSGGQLPSCVLARTDPACLCGGGVLIARDLFDHLGGFDEKYVLCSFQDIDLSLRIKHRGYDIAYCPYIQLIQPVPPQETSDGPQIERDRKRLMELWGKEAPGFPMYAV